MNKTKPDSLPPHLSLKRKQNVKIEKIIVLYNDKCQHFHELKEGKTPRIILIYTQITVKAITL